MVRKGLFILYSCINLLTVYAVYTSFYSQNRSEHVVMNILAYYLAPIFFLIYTTIAYLLLFIINRVEKTTNTYQFSTLTKLVGISLIIAVILYSLRPYW